MAANGIRQARISEPWNDLPGWKYRVAVARKFGLDPIVNLIYSVSPVHTDDYYAERCRQAVTLKPFRLCLKDPGGLLTPERARPPVPGDRDACRRHARRGRGGDRGPARPSAGHVRDPVCS